MPDLAATAGGPLPPGFDALPADASAALERILHAALQQRRTRLDEAISGSLRQLPALLRGPVRRVLGV